MGFILGTLLDPLSNNLSLLRSEGVPVLGWWHDCLGISANDAQEGLARSRIPRDNRLDTILVDRGSSLKGIKPQIGLPLFTIGAVA